MKWKRQDIMAAVVLFLSDALGLSLACAGAFWLRFHSGLIPLRGWPRFSYLPGYGFLLVIWLFILYTAGLYDTRRRTIWVDELYEILKAASAATLIALAASFFFRPGSYSRLNLVLTWMLGVIFIVFLRRLIYGVRNRMRREGRDLRRAALIGEGVMARTIVRTIRSDPSLGFHVVGYVTDAPEEVSTFGSLTSLGHLDDLLKIIEDHRLDALIATYPLQSHHKLRNVMERFQGLSVDFYFVPDVQELRLSRVALSDLGGIPLLSLKEFPLSGPGRIAKRAFDIVFSSVALICCLPIMGVIALAIKLTSRGPVFFRQERVGQDGKVFHMLKFRSMRVDAEKESGPIFAAKNDGRRTPVGTFLRKFSLDEIPQFINVLTGDMSVVGPRPERPHFVQEFNGMVPRYFERHLVKSGITGWAQVNGLRGNTSIEERVRYDLYYIENWSFQLDLKIISRTILQFVRQYEAY